MVNQNDAIAVGIHRFDQPVALVLLSVGHWFKLTERQYVDLTDFGITEEMQKPAAH